MDQKNWILMSMIMMMSGLAVGKEPADMAPELNQSFLASPAPVIWSSDGENCLVKSAPNQLDIYDSSGNLLWSKSVVTGDALFSPAGNIFLYVIPGDGIYSYSFTTNTETKIYSVPEGNRRVGMVAWSPTGQKIAFWLLTVSGEEIPLEAELMVIDPNGQNSHQVTDINFNSAPQMPLAESTGDLE